MGFEEAKKLDDRFVMHTFNRKPVMLVEGSGMEVTDDEGKTYLDFIAGIGADSLGHCHPAVSEAIAAQAKRLIHVSNYYYIESRGEVAKLISDMLNTCVPKFFRAPWPVFFANSGAEANECAIKLARLYSKKYGSGGQTIITMDGSFHGRTLATLAATAQPAKQEAFAPLPDGFIHVPMNDMNAVHQAFYNNIQDVCAVMLECVQGESGVHPWDPDTLFEVARFCHKNGILLIVDEVQSGFYRCGEFPFSFQNMGITPDIITMAKGIASGFPMGACAARIEVAEAFEPGDHGSTFGGSNLAMAAAHATLATLTHGHFDEDVQELGEYFSAGLGEIDGIAEVRGLGLMIGADLEEGIDANLVVAKGLEDGFLLNATGPQTLRFLPPLIVTRKEIDQLLKALPGMIAAVRDGWKPAEDEEEQGEASAEPSETSATEEVAAEDAE